MDWLDSYLDNLADGRNVIYPPDKNTWTPLKPSVQQQRMVQDAVAFDQQCQMRMIQEARHELEAHGMSHADVTDGIGADPGSPAVQSITNAQIIPQNGLQLWLRADAGIAKFSYGYVSQIVITGTSTPDVNGTYEATSVPAWFFEDGAPYSYSLAGPDGKIITWNTDGSYSFKVQDAFESPDGVSWSPISPAISQVFVTGFTGIYAPANGTYDYDVNSGRFYGGQGGSFYIEGNALFYDAEGGIAIATTDTLDYSGSWTPTTYISRVALAGATNATSINGNYNATEALFVNGWTHANGGYIYSDGIYVVTNGEWSNAYISYDLVNWSENGAPSPAPTGTITNTARSIGSPSSTSVVTPAGTITGTVSSVTVNTEYIDSWTDQSENNYIAGTQQSDPSTWYRASFVTIADNAFVSFPNISNSNLAITPPVLASYTGTVFAVSRFASASQGDYAALFSQENNFLLARGWAYDSINALQINNGAGPVVSNVQVDNDTNYVLETTFANSLANLYVNGAAAGSGLIGNADVGSNTFIGGGNEPCIMAEVIVYDRVLAHAERQQVEAYLAQKYSIALTPSDTSFAYDNGGMP
jgi:hypothetical protein